MDLLTKTEVARFLRCEVKTIKYYVSTRQIPFVMIGKEAMFRQESVLSWLEKREHKAAVYA
jgi:excisionase family DNA binding protein